MPGLETDHVREHHGITPQRPACGDALLSLARSPKRQTPSNRALPVHSVPSSDLAVRIPSSVVSVVAVDIDSVLPSQRITLP